MSLFVNICSKLDPKVVRKYNKLVVNDLNTSVKTLSEMVCNELDLREEQFDLMCFGRIMVSDKSLDSYGIANGTTVWVIDKTNLVTDQTSTAKKVPEPVIKTKISQSEIQNMVIALKTALMNPAFRQMLDKLNDPEFRETLMSVTPGLREDNTALAILQDPTLLSHLSEPTNIHKVLEKHPCLLEAATFLSATFHEECIANESAGPSTGLSRSTSGLDYSLDAMSSDEEMEAGEPQSDETARRIANMMVQAFQNQGSGSSSNQSAQGLITQDMLRQALQHSQPSTSAPTAPTTRTPSTSSPSAGARMRQWAQQLQQLRDLGITDEIVALQALEATDGDVQAAINIIFSDNN